MAHPAPAQAQDASPDVLNKVTNLNKRALGAYQKKDYTAARAFLKDALDICANSGLAKHPIKARTHIHLGIVLINGFKQRDAGMQHFKKALQIQPDIQLTKSVSTPALQEAFEEAMVGLGGAGAAEPEGGGGEAQTDGEPAGGGGGGSEASGDEGSPRRLSAPPRRRRRSGDDDENGGAVAKRRDDDDDDDNNQVGANNKGKIFIGITMGSGFGIASGSGDMTSRHSLGSAGFAPAQLGHISPEVGYFLNSKLLLSLQGRFQYISGLNPGPTTCNLPGGATMSCVPKTTALAGFARATYFILDGDFHLFFGGSLGVGTIRHVSLFADDTSCGSGRTQCVDTIKAGPVLVGPNVGLSFDINKTVALVLSVNTQVGVPNFTFNFDGNVGLGLKF
ncbi:MAG TPA: tetratricopeptide repeat protein [Polyangia bacterium]|nr:tetratricopeptide repeat protein [Polyangia bacterium]